MGRREVVKCLVEEYHIDTTQLNEVCDYLVLITPYIATVSIIIIMMSCDIVVRAEGNKFTLVRHKFWTMFRICGINGTHRHAVCISIV